MKDQNKLLKKCILNDIPAIVFQGTDGCAIEILQAAADIYKKNGCSEEFLYDFKQLIENFKGYQAENPKEIKVPALTDYEKEVVRMNMQDANLTPQLPNEIEDFREKKNPRRKDNQDAFNKAENNILNEKHPNVTPNKEICSSKSRTLIGDFTAGKDSQMTNFRILDKSTGKTESINTNGIDLSKESPATLKKILSGGKANTSSGLLQLSKTSLGWGLTVVKQLFSTVDTSAEI